MDTTATALAGIAGSLAPSPASVWIDGAQLVAALASIFAVGVAVFALRAERASRTADSLLRLIEHFDSGGYFLIMWRLEQASRGANGPSSITPVPITSLTQHEKPVIAELANGAFASDWSISRADMFAVYFFALRVHAWLGPAPRVLRDAKVRQLNDTFGHQLLSTLLNHWMVACRVRSSRAPAGDYYPTHYGLFDRDYRDLVDRLAVDLLSGERLHTAVRVPMQSKRVALDAHLAGLTSMDSAADVILDETS